MTMPNQPATPPAAADRRLLTPMGRAIIAGVAVRDEDVESISGLQWTALLMRVIAGIFLLRMAVQLMFAVTSTTDVSTVSQIDDTLRFASSAVLFWGAGELAGLAITMHHDMRATRILMARLVHRSTPAEQGVKKSG